MPLMEVSYNDRRTKKFKILKRESYQDQVSKESKIAVEKTLLIGMGALIAVNSFIAGTNEYAPDALNYANLSLGTLNAVLTVHPIKRLVKSISKITTLEGKIEEINDELAMSDNEESRGMRRWQLKLRIP